MDVIYHSMEICTKHNGKNTARAPTTHVPLLRHGEDAEAHAGARHEEGW